MKSNQYEFGNIVAWNNWLFSSDEHTDRIDALELLMELLIGIQLYLVHAIVLGHGSCYNTINALFSKCAFNSFISYNCIFYSYVV